MSPKPVSQADSTTKTLLDKGANVNATDDKGVTALMLASRNGRHEIVKDLVERGAEINFKDKDGVTALMLASRGGHREVKKLLQRAGAK